MSSQQRVKKCPICQKESVKTYRPFCSKACKDIDLHRWFGGVYAIPGEPATAEDLAQHLTAQQHEENKKPH